MNSVESYFTALVALSILSAMISCFLKEGLQKQIIFSMCGVLLLIVLIRPITKLDPKKFESFFDSLLDNNYTQEEYNQLYAEKFAEQVEQSTENAVMQKAQELGAWVNVKVELTQEEFPVPYKIEIYGSLTSIQAAQLKTYITESIGITAENQTWRFYE